MKTREFKEKIEITNDGQLSMFFVGSGNAFSYHFYQSNVLIIKGNTHLLIDCGSLFSFILKTVYNSTSGDIKNILLTHPHADHVGGVEELVLKARYERNRKVNIIITDAFKKLLWNNTLKGGIQYSENGLLRFEDYFNQFKPKMIMKKPFEMFQINFENLDIKLFRTKHVTARKESLFQSQPSYGLIIDNKILFTGDTQFNSEQLQFILFEYDIQWIFHDCDMSGNGSVHATYNSLKNLAPQVKSKMFLYHYSSAKESVDPVKDGFAGFAQKGIYYDF